MITRWNDPFRELESFRHQMNRLFNEGYSQVGAARGDEGVAAAWAPPVDIAETAEALTFVVELPGFRTEDLTLRAENGVLTLEGERKFEKETKQRSYHRVERAYGRFLRSFSLPSNVDTDRIQAALTDGVLTVELPKREEAKPKSIPIGRSTKHLSEAKA